MNRFSTVGLGFKPSCNRDVLTNKQGEVQFSKEVIAATEVQKQKPSTAEVQKPYTPEVQKSSWASLKPPLFTPFGVADLLKPRCPRAECEYINVLCTSME